MPRSSSFRAALAGLLTAGLASVGAQAPAAATPAEEGDPLVVHIDTIDPVLPRSGDVVITGTVTNVSQDTYTRINLHAFSSEQPILESANLVTSAASDPVQAVGERVTVPGTFYTVDELAPGESAYFSDTVPVELLDMDPRVEGVYWIGIHALGDGAVPRDTIADGRARTFIPAQPSSGHSAEASIVLSVRSRVWFTDDGKVGGLDRWEKRLAEGGSLDGVLDMADSADGTPYSWLVDPAVLVALTRLERANPARSIVPDPNIPDQQPSETPAAEGDEPIAASGGWDTLAPPTSPTAEPTAQEQALATAAASWLNRFRDLVGTQPVLTLPFGDLDVSAAVRNDRTRLDQAVARSAEVMQVLRLPSRPAVSPTSDLLSPEALQTVAPDTVILLGDSAFDIPPTTPNSVVRMLGHKVLVTSTAAESGGPGPTAATDPLAMRQRLLSEAALRALDDDSAPLIITMPTVWRGEDAAAFFDGLEQPWLDIVPVEQIADAPNNAVGQPASALNYTTKDQGAEIGAGNFTAATRATNAATLLETVLRLQTTIEAQVRDEALVTLSEQHRTRPGIALKAAGRVERAMKDYLAKVQIEAPGAVTLFSASGKLGATLVNNLDQPVTVEVRPTTDGELTIDGLSGERNLAPGARTVLRYDASTDKLGVHSIRFAVTSLDGAPLGSSDALTIRVARVSALVWVAMAGGALVLFGMIGYRLPGQIRARRAELAAASRGEDAVEPEDEPAEVRDARDEGPSDVRPEPSAATPLLPGRP